MTLEQRFPEPVQKRLRSRWVDPEVKYEDIRSQFGIDGKVMKLLKETWGPRPSTAFGFRAKKVRN